MHHVTYPQLNACPASCCTAARECSCPSVPSQCSAVQGNAAAPPCSPVTPPLPLLSILLLSSPLTALLSAPRPPSLQEPAKAEVAQVFEECKDMGLLLGKGGLHGNVFRIKPPMCITQPDVDFLLETMDTALARL